MDASVDKACWRPGTERIGVDGAVRSGEGFRTAAIGSPAKIDVERFRRVVIQSADPKVSRDNQSARRNSCEFVDVVVSRVDRDVNAANGRMHDTMQIMLSRRISHLLAGKGSHFR
jgi:hypothetical protein